MRIRTSTALALTLAAALPVIGLVPTAGAATPGQAVPSTTAVTAALAGAHVHLMPPRGAKAAAAPRTTATTAATPMSNSAGGPVQTAPKIYVDYWGWTSDPSGVQPYLNQFYSSVGSSPWSATVMQYGAVAQPGMLAGTWSDPSAVPAAPTDAQIQAEADAAANHFGTGTSVNVQIIVATPTGHSTPGFISNFCGYHGTLAALPNVTYTDLPYTPDAGGSCGGGSITGSALDGVSIIAGHELAETITDPLLNAWKDSTGAEIGDKCAWTNDANVDLSGSNFPMQTLWSNGTSGCTMASGDWSKWMSYGAPSAGIASGSSPTVSSWGENRLDVFVRGADGAFWHKPYDSQMAGWYPWESMGGTWLSNPAAVSWDNTRVDLFGVGTDNNIWHRYWNSTTGWANWNVDFSAPPPGIASGASPDVISWGSGRLDLFIRGNDNAIWHMYYSNGWSGWESLGASIISDPSATTPNSNRIDLFGTGTDNNIWHKYWSPSTGWTNWSPDLGAVPGGLASGSSPAASLWRWNAGSIEVYARGQDGAIYSNYFDGSNWGGWSSHGGVLTSNATAISRGPDVIDMFAIGTNGQLYEQFWA